MLQTLYMFFKPHLLPLLYALVIVAVLPLLAGYVVLLERKVMADMQARLGPMRVGPHGLLQPIADAVNSHVVADRPQILRALAHQCPYQILRHPAQAEASDHDGGAVEHVADGLIRIGHNFVHSEKDSK